MSAGIERTVPDHQQARPARAASAKFVTLASSQPVEVQVRKDDGAVTGTSIMGLMMLAPPRAIRSRSARRATGRRRR